MAMLSPRANWAISEAWTGARRTGLHSFVSVHLRITLMIFQKDLQHTEPFPGEHANRAIYSYRHITI